MFHQIFLGNGFGIILGPDPVTQASDKGHRLGGRGPFDMGSGTESLWRDMRY